MHEYRAIYSNTPTEEQWRRLLAFSYPANVRRYLANDTNTPDDTIVESVAGSFSQAAEYFRAANSVSMEISPLLLYYGTVNLLVGIGTLRTRSLCRIENHGLILVRGKSINRMADLVVRALGNKSGALEYFTRIYWQSDILAGSEWSLQEVLASIPDLYDDFMHVYGQTEPYVVPVQRFFSNNDYFEQIAKHDVARFKSVDALFQSIEGFSEGYLDPQIVPEYVVLRRRLHGKEIGVFSLSGQKYLPIAHRKQGKQITPPIILLLFIGLFTLGYVSRYEPRLWSPFVQRDDTGERLLLATFLDHCWKAIPLISLSYLYGTRIRFVTEEQGITDRRAMVPEVEIRRIVSEEIRRKLR